MPAGVLPGDAVNKIKPGAEKPRLLLHCCCAPCAASVLERLAQSFIITAFFYNPNIRPEDEFIKRANELVRLMDLAEYPSIENVIICDYDMASFDEAAATFADEPEGGLRCNACFELRLRRAAVRAKAGGLDFFATTLSVSPHKDAALLNEIGCAVAGQCGVYYLISDFKKKAGYQRSVELSKEYGLYRQPYCGCMI